MSNKTFGVYLETAGNAVANIDSVKKYIDIISMLGYNKFYLGCADTFKIDGEPYFGYMKGAYSKAELKEIDEYAKSKNIMFVLNIQTLAHQSSIPAYERFKPIIDYQNVLLCDNEKTYEFIDKMLKTVSEVLSSKTVHLGMDEAFLLGSGKYQKEHGFKEKKEIFIKHLKRVIEIASKYDLNCEIWGDMLFHSLNRSYSNTLSTDGLDYFKENFPDNLKLIYWNYSNSSEEEIIKGIEANKVVTKNIAYASTLYNWVGFAPDNINSLNNAKLLIDSLEKTNVNDFFLTIWSDSGRDGSIYSILPALYTYSEIYYKRATSFSDVNKNRFKELFNVDMDDFLKVDLLNKPFKNKSYPSVNNKSFLYLYNDPLIGIFDSLLSDGISDAYKEVSKELSNIKPNEYSYMFDTLKALSDCLVIKADLGKRIRVAYTKNNKKELKRIAKKDIPKLIPLVEILFNKFKIQFLKEMKSFGFEIHTARIGSLILRLKFVKEQLLNYANGKLIKIDELEEKQEPFGYNLKATEDNYFLMCWINIFTSNVCL